MKKETKEQKLIKELAEALGYVAVDANLALEDIWDRGDDGFVDQRDMVWTALDKVRAYNEKLYDEALKKPRAFVDDIEVEEGEERKVYL